MAGLQLSGLASGFDWKSVVDQLIELERVPQNQMRTRKTTNLGKLATFATLRTRVSELGTAAKALNSSSLFSQRTVGYGEPDLTWSATAANSATTGEYRFDVAQIATRSVRTGVSGRASPLHDSSDVSALLVSELRLAAGVTEGVFSVNGAQVEVESTDSLEDVFDKISTATGGTVTAAYATGSDRVTLTSGSTITLGSGADTSNFLYALKLFNNSGNTVTSSTALAAINLDEPLEDSGLATAITGLDAEGNGTFAINGVAISYNVETDSLRDLMRRISSSAAGVNASYDASGDRFALTNKTTGDLGIAVADTTGNLLAALGINAGATVVRGDNAEFSVNGGGTIVSSSNVLSSAAHGITGLTVTATSVAEQTITIAADTESLEAGIRNFIQKFNSVQQFVDEQTKITVNPDGSITAAPFANNREFTDLARNLRSRVFGSVPGLTGSVRRLESMGIDFEGSSSQLTIKDPAALTNALSGNLDDVAALFSTSTTGISAKIDSYVAALTRTSGLLDTQENSLEKQNSSLDNQISELERRLETERTRLESSFIRMEEAQSLMQSQLTALQQTLNLG